MKLDGCLDHHPEERSVHSAQEVAEESSATSGRSSSLVVIALPFQQVISREDVGIFCKLECSPFWINPFQILKIFRSYVRVFNPWILYEFEAQVVRGSIDIGIKRQILCNMVVVVGVVG